MHCPNLTLAHEVANFWSFLTQHNLSPGWDSGQNRILSGLTQQPW